MIIYKSNSQSTSTDTSAFKKDFEKLLLKYKIQSKGYFINVTSINQSGGQTAFIITNNYFGDSVLNVTNFYFTITDKAGQKILTVSPQKGVWSTPYVTTDSLKATRKFYDPGFGKIISISGIIAYVDQKKYTLVGAAQDGACSKRFPLQIYLANNDPDEFYVFGDLQEPNKTYLYYKGEVTWFPPVDN